jgi:uncharacterized OB-fold protein
MDPSSSLYSAGGRELPLLLPWNRFFWEAGADGRLRISRCAGCRRFVHPPLPRCPSCHGATAPEPVSGRARVAAVTVNEHAWSELPTPYVVAIVELEEDAAVRLTTNLVDCDPGQARIGLAVEVAFARTGDVWLPLFRPADAESAD